jgi:putative ABC transport system substrate-binding protein
MTKKIILLALCSLLLAPCSPVQAQQPEKIFRIGFLDPSNASDMAVMVDAFRQELSKLGWIEGKNITIEYRFAESKPDRLPELAADLVRFRVDLIVATGPPPALAAKNATATIPIVMASSSGDPVGAGLAASLARPGGNFTGFTGLSSELNTKGWRYLRMRFPSSPELDFFGRSQAKTLNGKSSGLRLWH